jgi:hypothetical protein
MIMIVLKILFLLVACHALLDFAIQGDAVAREKSRHSTSELQKHVPWYYWLSAHAFIHGAAVMLVTGSFVLGVLETASHWVIDFCKCEKWYSIHVDQALHLVCKVAWIALMILGLS